MLRISGLFLFLLMFVDTFESRFRQEGAVIKYYNPKYLSECRSLTARYKRGEPYKTNITATVLHEWNNNVTLKITYKLKGQAPMTVKQRICEMVDKHKWFFTYLTSSSNMTGCPLVSGTYRLYHMEFPPKNFPWPIPRGEISLKLYMVVTKTDELIAELNVIIHVK